MSKPTVLRKKTGPKPKPLAKRFWSKVDKSAGPDGCWTWTASTIPQGYGQIWSKEAQRPVRAHRVAWELVKGPIPDGLNVLHDCDNPPCCNPSHFFLGTHKDNAADKVAKGRQTQGEGFSHAKLTADRVRSLRMIRELGATYQQLADMFDVGIASAYRVCKRQTWRHVD